MTNKQMIEEMAEAIYSDTDGEITDRRAAKAAAEVAERVMGKQWREIESAPKNGKQVLLFDDGEGVCIGQYTNFYESSLWSNDQRNLTLDPTHWMPLPQPPKGGQDGNE